MLVELAGLVPLGVRTVTSTTPIAPIGEATVIEVLEFTVKLVVLFGPKNTAVAPVKYVPLIVTVVPPSAGPEAGETDDTVGPGR